MKFITLWTSETGKKFKALETKMEEVRAAARAFANKYMVKEWQQAYWSKVGGISAVRFEEGVIVDESLWKKHKDRHNFWEPRCNSKAGKALDKEMMQLPKIRPCEVNEIIGWDESFSSIGFNLENKKYVGIDCSEEWKIKMPKDCKEITVTEWNKLFPEKKEKKKLAVV